MHKVNALLPVGKTLKPRGKEVHMQPLIEQYLVIIILTSLA